MDFEKFKHVKASPEIQADIDDFIAELRRDNWREHGAGGAAGNMKSYDSWINDLEDGIKGKTYENPLADTMFLLRVNDNRIVGLVCIREENRETNDSEKATVGGQISYYIRPSERRKGYNKLNLYMALKECKRRGMTDVELLCDKSNVAAVRSIKSMHGRLMREFANEWEIDHVMQAYSIDIDFTLNKYAPYFEQLIEA